MLRNRKRLQLLPKIKLRKRSRRRLNKRSWLTRNWFKPNSSSRGRFKTIKQNPKMLKQPKKHQLQQKIRRPRPIWPNRKPSELRKVQFRQNKQPTRKQKKQEKLRNLQTKIMKSPKKLKPKQTRQLMMWYINLKHSKRSNNLQN